MTLHYFANKGPSSQSYGFSSSHVWMWELDYKESWAPRNWCFWTVVLEKTLESPLDYKEIKPVHPKGNQSWIFIGRTDAEAETPILWPPDAKSWLIWKDPDSGTDWRQEEKGTTADETVGWHHWLYRHEFEQAPGIGDRQRSLACCSPWGRKESDTTERLNWTELTQIYIPSPDLSSNMHFKHCMLKTELWIPCAPIVSYVLWKVNTGRVKDRNIKIKQTTKRMCGSVYRGYITVKYRLRWGGLSSMPQSSGGIKGKIFPLTHRKLLHP